MFARAWVCTSREEREKIVGNAVFTAAWPASSSVSESMERRNGGEIDSIA